MFPVTVQFIVAMLAYALNERMARRLDYCRRRTGYSKKRSRPQQARAASL